MPAGRRNPLGGSAIGRGRRPNTRTRTGPGEPQVFRERWAIPPRATGRPAHEVSTVGVVPAWSVRAPRRGGHAGDPPSSIMKTKKQRLLPVPYLTEEHRIGGSTG